jgi:nicotinate-nucleotide adenylyltransferase
VRRVGIFGGTFDPVHDGHLKPAAQAVAALGLDELVFVPAAIPPHKLDEPRTAFAHRFAMLALATQDDDRSLVSDIEMERDGPSYTFDTLYLFRERHHRDGLFFLMGSDSFAQISTWHRWDELLDLANLVVLRRPTAWGAELLACVPEALRPRVTHVAPGAVPGHRRAPGHRIYLLDHEPYPISSTEVRGRVRAGRPIDDLMPAAVGRYIVKHGLYRGGERGGDER